MCPKGSYSDWNSLAKDNSRCIQCSNNLFSSNIYNLTSFSNVDNLISTTCKSENSKNCENIKGFQPKFDKIISVKKFFIQGTYLPINVQLEMTIKFSIIEPEGMINLVFDIQNILVQDSLSIMINNRKYGVYFRFI